MSETLLNERLPTRPFDHLCVRLQATVATPASLRERANICPTVPTDAASGRFRDIASVLDEIAVRAQRLVAARPPEASKVKIEPMASELRSAEFRSFHISIVLDVVDLKSANITKPARDALLAVDRQGLQFQKVSLVRRTFTDRLAMSLTPAGISRACCLRIPLPHASIVTRLFTHVRRVHSNRGGESGHVEGGLRLAPRGP